MAWVKNEHPDCDGVIFYPSCNSAMSQNDIMDIGIDWVVLNRDILEMKCPSCRHKFKVRCELIYTYNDIEYKEPDNKEE